MHIIINILIGKKAEDRYEPQHDNLSNFVWISFMFGRMILGGYVILQMLECNDGNGPKSYHWVVVIGI